MRTRTVQIPHSKIPVVTDTHWGARNDNPVVWHYFDKFYRDVYLPGVMTLPAPTVSWHLGDLVDRRKFINYGTLDYMHRSYLDRNPLRMEWTIGNHDASLRSTNRLNASLSLNASVADRINVMTGPEEVTYVYPTGQTTVLFVPWICDENYQETLAALKTTKATIVAGHLELLGFDMYRGIEAHDGLSPDLFSHFPLVLTGHYHHKSSKGDIHYLGAPYEMTWSDYNDPRGFHIVDLADLSLAFHQNPHRLFYQFDYDDSAGFNAVEDLLDTLKTTTEYEDKFIKVVIRNKTNPAWFDMFMDAVYHAKPYDVSTVDESMFGGTPVPVANTTHAPVVTDTLNLIQTHIDTQAWQPDTRTAVTGLLHSLYREALEQESLNA